MAVKYSSLEQGGVFQRMKHVAYFVQCVNPGGMGVTNTINSAEGLASKLHKGMGTLTLHRTAWVPSAKSGSSSSCSQSCSASSHLNAQLTQEIVSLIQASPETIYFSQREKALAHTGMNALMPSQILTLVLKNAVKLQTISGRAII